MDDARGLPAETMRWLEGRHQAVLATSRQDGTPQTSNVAYGVLDGQALVSVTDGRAKTRNLRRLPRAVLHVLGDDFGQYAAVTCDAQLTPVTTEPGDATGRRLLAVYEAIRGEPHPDPDEFFGAMVDEQRLLLVLTPASGTGWQVPGLG